MAGISKAERDRRTAATPDGEMQDASTTVRMRRDPDQANGGPTTADVHPDEVETWGRLGWNVETE